MRFDVYGRMVVVVERAGDGWRAWRVGPDGKRTELRDIPFPWSADDEVSEETVSAHLEDVFHEYGTEGRTLRRLG